MRPPSTLCRDCSCVGLVFWTANSLRIVGPQACCESGPSLVVTHVSIQPPVGAWLARPPRENGWSDWPSEINKQKWAACGHTVFVVLKPGVGDD